MHEPDLDTACVALANELIVQLRVPFPRIQCVLEIGSTLFCSLFHILCGYLPTGIIEYPQSIDDERKNLDIILHEFSKNVLDVELPHIKTDKIIVCDSEAIYYLLEIFKKYSLLFPPEVPVVSHEEAGSDINHANFIEARQIDVSKETDVIVHDRPKNKHANVLPKKIPVVPIKIPTRLYQHEVAQYCDTSQPQRLNISHIKPKTIYHSCPSCPKTTRLASGSQNERMHQITRNLTNYYEMPNDYSGFHELPNNNSSCHHQQQQQQQQNGYSSMQQQPDNLSWASHLSSGSVTSTSSCSGETLVEQSLSSSPDVDGDQRTAPLEIHFRNQTSPVESAFHSVEPLSEGLYQTVSPHSETHHRTPPSRPESQHQRASARSAVPHRTTFESVARCQEPPSPAYRVSSPSTESWFQEPVPLENRYVTPSAPPETLYRTPAAQLENQYQRPLAQTTGRGRAQPVQNGSRRHSPPPQSGSRHQRPGSRHHETPPPGSRRHETPPPGSRHHATSPRPGSRHRAPSESPEIQCRMLTPPSLKRVRFTGKQREKESKRKSEKRNWKDGVVLCAETYGFKVPAKDWSVSLKGNIKSMKLNYKTHDNQDNRNCRNRENCENRECGGNDTSDVVRNLLLSQLRAQINRMTVNSRKANYKRIQNFQKEEKIHACQIKRCEEIVQAHKGSRLLREPLLLTENNQKDWSRLHFCPGIVR